jgi:hypothetical protein
VGHVLFLFAPFFVDQKCLCACLRVGLAERRRKLDADDQSIKNGAWKPKEKEDKAQEKPIIKEVERVRREESGEHMCRPSLLLHQLLNSPRQSSHLRPNPQTRIGQRAIGGS